VKATELEVNGEKLETVVLYYNWVSYVRARNLCTVLQDWDSNILHGDPNGMTFETVGVLQD
jgi:hypothetical protein